jgi:hypothetical protein
MSVETGAEAAQFPGLEYIIGIVVAVLGGRRRVLSCPSVFPLLCSSWCTARTLHQKYETTIPRREKRGPHFQFPRSFFCERFIMSLDRSSYFAAENAERGLMVEIYCINHLQTHECGHW